MQEHNRANEWFDELYKKHENNHNTIVCSECKILHTPYILNDYNSPFQKEG
jgi:hypothetical protein